PGVTGWRNAAMMLSDISLPGWGFGEYVRVDQSGDPNQPSYLVAHDESCDWQPIVASATAIGMVGGIEPALFAGPGPQQLAAICETCDPGPNGGDPPGHHPPNGLPPPPQALFGSYQDVNGYSLNQVGIGGTIWLAKATD